MPNNDANGTLNTQKNAYVNDPFINDTKNFSVMYVPTYAIGLAEQ